MNDEPRQNSTHPDDRNMRVRRIDSFSATAGTGTQAAAPSQDGTEACDFGSNDVHTETIEAETLVTKWSFRYDAENRVVAVYRRRRRLGPKAETSQVAL